MVVPPAFGADLDCGGIGSPSLVLSSRSTPAGSGDVDSAGGVGVHRGLRKQQTTERRRPGDREAHAV